MIHLHGVDLTIRQRVKLMCEKESITLYELAHKMNTTASSLSSRLKTGKFTKAELQNIASAAGCKYDSWFAFNNDVKISARDNGQQVKDALAYIDMSASEMGRKMGLSQQSISKRLMVGKLTQDDLKSIAGYMGCEYVSEFQFNDGSAI